MIIQVLECGLCQSQNVIRHGKDGGGRQRYRCQDCRHTFQQQHSPRRHSAAFQQRVLAAYQERASMRGVCRVFGIGRNTLSRWLKKSRGPAAAQ